MKTGNSPLPADAASVAPEGERQTEAAARDRLTPLRLLRWQGRRLAAALRYGPAALARSPLLFGNSVPKSGTHLLAQILSAFPGVGLAVDRGMGPILTYERQTGRLRATAELLGDLQRLKAGDLCFGHVIAAPEIVQLWSQPSVASDRSSVASDRSSVAHFFMLRDPRDVVISHAFYIADKATQNVHHAYYKSLPTLDDRIRVSILGRPDWQAAGATGGDFPDIRGRFEKYLGWLEDPHLCLLRYEEFIQDRQANLERMLDYACQRGFQLHLPRAQALASLSEAIQPKRSFTFRKGESGEWKQHFTAEHKQLFKEAAGDLLIQLGYEKDNDW